MYPNTLGVRFNHEYYPDKYMPMMQFKMGAAFKLYAVWQWHGRREAGQIEGRFEQQLLERLLRECRSFVKGLPYTLHQGPT